MTNEILAGDKLLNSLPDPTIDPRLLPHSMRIRTSYNRFDLYRFALKEAMKHCITPEQKSIIEMHYLKGKKRIEIAKELNIKPSTVTKKLQSGEAAIREYTAIYIEIYEMFEKNFLRED